LPLVAIGGIHSGNAREVLAAGADSVAMVSALVFEPNLIEQNTRKILSLLS
jgi:thiamine-phosphate pyrophosphorylase